MVEGGGGGRGDEKWGRVTVWGVGQAYAGRTGVNTNKSLRRAVPLCLRTKQRGERGGGGERGAVSRQVERWHPTQSMQRNGAYGWGGGGGLLRSGTYPPNSTTLRRDCTGVSVWSLRGEGTHPRGCTQGDVGGKQSTAQHTTAQHRPNQASGAVARQYPVDNAETS